LRWFWWRINAYSEITAMIVSFLMAIYFELFYKGQLEPYEKMIIAVGVTTCAWVILTYLTRPTHIKTLKKFYQTIQPHDLGWKPILNQIDAQDTIAKPTRLSQEILMMFLGSLMIYALLFGTGYVLYGNMLGLSICAGIIIICGLVFMKIWK